jgi:hypothetical protein
MAMGGEEGKDHQGEARHQVLLDGPGVRKRRGSLASPENRLVGAAICVSLLFAGGCWNPHEWVEKERPWSEGTVSGVERVRIQKTDGDSLTLEHPSIVESTYLTGAAAGHAHDRLRVELSSIHRLEAWELNKQGVVEGIVAGVVAGIAIVLYALHGSSH